MLMSDDCDSMFDLNCLDKRPASWALSEDDFLPFTAPPVSSKTTEDPFLGRRPDSLRLSVDRQASLEDIAHVIRGGATLDAPSLNDGADTIQDLAKYLKDDSQNSPTIPNLIAAAGFPYPANHQPSSLASVHNYASRGPTRTTSSLADSAYGSASETNASPDPKPIYPALINIKQERPDTPNSDISDIGNGGTDRDERYSMVYQPSLTRRKRSVAYKEEMEDEEYYQQERDADLPPPRKYVRKNPKSIKDLEEYRKRRERNNEAVRRARAKKRQNEAIIHNENRALRAENNRLKTELEATRMKADTQERVIAQLRGTSIPSATQPQPRIKKTPRRLSP